MNQIEQSKEELVNLEKAIFQSILSQDGATLSSHLADDFIGIGFAGQHVDKNIYIKVHTNPDDPFVKADVEHISIEIQDNIAYIKGVQDVTAALHLKSYYIGIYKKLSGQWKLFYWQETALVDEKIFSIYNTPK